MSSLRTVIPRGLEFMRRCRLCRADAVAELVDFGPQPISNRYLAHPSDDEALFPLVLSRCESCGLVQLTRSPPARELTPRYPWIAYREPESHLDNLADRVSRLPGLDRESPIWGVSSKDDTLLERMARLGFRNTYRLDPARDLEIPVPHAGVEAVQDRLTPQRAAALTTVHGRPQVIVARHIIEHAHDLRRFLDALAALLAPAGYLVLEAPDCRSGFALCDATTVWEEHVAYFTAMTFPLVFEHIGHAICNVQSFPYGLENVLTGIGQAASSVRADIPRFEPAAVDADRSHERTAMEAFSKELESNRGRMAALLADRRRRGEAVAILGAGHRACAFVNLLGLREHISWAADDDPHKQGLFMPGSRLPIRGSHALREENVGLCLLSVNPEAEENVIHRNRALVERGGQFVSIFAASSRAFTA